MSALKVLILGATGMLGHKLVQNLPGSGVEVWAGVRGPAERFASYGILPRGKTLGDLDATRPESIRSAIEELQPDAVINAVGVVKQKAEARHAALTIEINALFPHRLYSICRDNGARLVHISTDCVFSGAKGGYAEDDLTDARDLYGLSKTLGEVVGDGAVTLRTSIIGRELSGSHGLLEWFLANAGGRVKGFTNAYFSGLTTGALAEAIGERVLPDKELEGIFHVASERISKYRLLTRIDSEMALGTTIVEDDGLEIDRSLKPDKFREATGYSAPSWDEMIGGISSDPSPYEEWRKLNT